MKDADTSRRLGVESPVLPPNVSQARGEGEFLKKKLNVSPVIDFASVIQGVPPQQTVKAEPEDPEGWVTNSVQSPANHQQQKHVGSMGREGITPPAAQRGESVRLRAEGQDGGNYGKYTWSLTLPEDRT